MMNTSLTYADLAEAAALMADRLLAAQDQARDLNQKLAAVQGEVAVLRCALEIEQEHTRALRSRGDHWQIVATETPPRLGHLPRVASASPLSFFSKLRSALA
jgi:hypothetical protein